MPALIFLTPAGQATVPADEIDRLTRIVNATALAALDDLFAPPNELRLRALLSIVGHKLPAVPSSAAQQLLLTYFRNPAAAVCLTAGSPVVTQLFPMLLNTALEMGKKPIKLIVRLLGQAQLNCFVEHHDLTWFANLITLGESSGFLNAPAWSAVMQLVADGFAKDVPMVASWSAMFPPMLTSAGKIAHPWETALAVLRDDGSGQLRLSAKGFDAFRFSPAINLFDLHRLVEQIAATLTSR